MTTLQSPGDTAYRTFVSYIDKSREYYAAQGYERPYRWARFDDVPFTPVDRPLSALRFGLVTTATLPGDDPHRPPDERPQKGPYAAPVEPMPECLYTMDLSWDKEATHTDDLGSFFPAADLKEAARSGRIGSVSPRFYGVPTEYSQRTTKEHDAPAILEYMREDGVEAAVLVPL
jgi:hypothetical protein